MKLQSRIQVRIQKKKEKRKKLPFYKLISMCTRRGVQVRGRGEREREKGKGHREKGGEREESEGCAPGFEFTRRRTFIIRTGRERGP